MKRKLTVNTLAFGNLKHRKRQYVIMIVGIILAMVFSSSILFLISSFDSSIKQMNAEMYGRQDLIWSDADEKKINVAEKEKLIGKAGYSHIIGYGFSNAEEKYNGTYIAWLDDTAMELAYPVLSEGEFPSSENEIAMESLALVKLGIDAGIGDTITLKVNNQNGRQTYDDYAEKSYKLVGILKNRRNYLKNAHGGNNDLIPAAYVAKNTKVNLGGKETLAAYLDLYNNSDAVRETFRKEYCDNPSGYNADIIWFNEYDILYMGTNESFNVQQTVSFAVIMAAVLTLVSCTGIVNSFNSNLKERKKQIGMLRAVGATKRQIIKIFGREAFIISLIAAPLSIVLSYLAVLGIVKLLGDNFIFVPNFGVLILCGIFSIICVMLAALIPLTAASKITPIQAIRNIENNRKMNSRKIKSKKDFNVSSLISNRSITFGRGKQAIVSIILVVSIIASGYVFSWYSYSKDNFYHNNSDYEMYLSGGTNYNINYMSNNIGFSQEDKQMIENIPYIKNTVGVKSAVVAMIEPYSTSDYRKTVLGNYLPSYWDSDSPEEELEAERKVNKDNYEDILFPEKGNSLNPEFQKYLNCTEYVNTALNSADADYIKSLQKYVSEGEINIDKLNSGEEIILVAPKKVGMYFEDEKYGGIRTMYNDDVDKQDCIFSDERDFHVGDKIDLSVLSSSQPPNEDDTDSASIPADIKSRRKTVKIGAIIDEIPYSEFSSAYKSQFYILTTNSGLNGFISGIKYNNITASLDRKCTKEMDDEVTTAIKSITDNVENADFISDFSFQEQQKVDNNKTLIAMLALIILFLAICLSIINNSITSNIRNSKQKIGTLRAVGAGESELVLTYIKQLVSMLLWGMGIGFTGFFASYIIIDIVHKAHQTTMDMIFNPLGAVLFCVIVLAVCSVNLWSKIRKEMKNSIVENIREL